MTAEETSAAPAPAPILAHIAEIWRFPVKSMQGERLERCQVDEGGVVGDRAFVLRADSMRLMGSAKYFTDLLRCRARYLDEPGGAAPAPVEITLPDGSRLRSDAEDAATRLSQGLGGRFSLWSAPPGGAKDDAPIHLLSDASLTTLRSLLPDSAIDSRRFRANFVLDMVADTLGSPEWDWMGAILRIGGVRLAITNATVRCAMTTHPQSADLPRDPAILRALAEHAQRCLGVYALVLTPGEVRLGDPVTIEPVTAEAR